MSERAEIAAMALQGLLAAGPQGLSGAYTYTPDDLASAALNIADALIRGLDKPKAVRDEPTGDQPGAVGGQRRD
jgi:hypothetical protein